MSVDKLVDSTQLDADLTSVANAIRTKGGTSAQLAFPADFVQAIEDIETGGGSEVPDGYTQLEYIASDGTAYIDTGEYRRAGDEIDLYGGLVSVATTTSGYWHPFGSANCFLQANNGIRFPSAQCVVHLNSGGNTSNQTFSTYLCHYLIKDTTLEQYDFFGTISRTVATISGAVPTDAVSLVLLGRHKADGTVDYKAKGFGIFRFTWTRNNTLIHDMIPAMRDSDNVLGLYDVVTGNFLTNAAGSGRFSGGTIK